MDLSPFFIEFLHHNKLVLAEIKPCCNEDDVFYYDVAMNDQFKYTITPGASSNTKGWKLALMNADNNVDPTIISAIGKQIEAHYKR